jgi:hypothetical protein
MPWSTRDLDHSIWHQLYVDSLKTELKSQAYSRSVHYCAVPKKNIIVGDGYSSWVTVVAQQAKAPGIHGYVAGSIPAVTPRTVQLKQ